MTITFFPKGEYHTVVIKARQIKNFNPELNSVEYVDIGGNSCSSSGVPFIVDGEDENRVGLRQEVDSFSQSIEKILRTNAHKGHWGKLSVAQLFEKLEEEHEELRRAVLAHEGSEAVLHEASDVAAVAMMIADNVRNQ